MHPDRLFLARCDHIAFLQKASNEAEVLLLGGLLRQMLVDKHSLMDIVNTGRLKVRFSIPEPAYDENTLRKDGVFWYQNIYDETLNPVRRELSKDQFLAYKLVFARGDYATVKGLIRHSANVAGGFHFDPNPDPEYVAITARFAEIIWGGLPMEVHLLREIAHVTLRGLQPLIEAVKRRS